MIDYIEVRKHLEESLTQFGFELLRQIGAPFSLGLVGRALGYMVRLKTN